jgi:hypothetical protein
MGLMGASGLWTFTSPFILGAAGFKDMCFHFESFGMILLHSLRVDLNSRCSLFVLSRGLMLKLLSVMKWCILLM